MAGITLGICNNLTKFKSLRGTPALASQQIMSFISKIAIGQSRLCWNEVVSCCGDRNSNQWSDLVARLLASVQGPHQAKSSVMGRQAGRGIPGKSERAPASRYHWIQLYQIDQRGERDCLGRVWCVGVVQPGTRSFG